MRIAYISTARLPSTEANSIHVMRMAQALARLGHEVRLIAPCKPVPGGARAVEYTLSYYGVERIFEISKLPWSPFWGRSYLYGLLAARMAKAWTADLVYGRHIGGCFFAARLHLPTIFESHTPVNEQGALPKWLFSRLIVHPRFRGLIVITDALRRHYEAAWPPLVGRVFVAPDGADAVVQQVTTAHMGDGPGRFQVGYAGHLYNGKGMALIVELARCCPWADFHIFGGTPEDLSYWRESGHLPRNLTLHGFVFPSDVSRYLLALDVCLLPNQPDVYVQGGATNIGCWTSPLKAFEYMAAGRAIIASDLPVLREVLEHERNALLCPPSDVTAWVAALVRLRDEPELRERLGQKACQEFELLYTWEARAAAVCKFESRTGA